MRIFSLVILLALGLPLAAQPQPIDAADYFAYFNNEHTVISQRNMEYLQHAVHSDDPRQIADKRLALVRQLSEARERVKQVEEYAQDAGLRQEMLAVLDHYLDLFQLEFSQVEALRQQSQDSYEAMEQYLASHDAAEHRLATAAERFVAAQRKFAAANGMTLLPGAEHSEATQINQLNRYQRQLFMSSFRIERRNAQFFAAYEAKDAAAMGGHRVALLRELTEELKKVTATDAFNGNTAYRDAIKTQLLTYQEMADGAYKDLIKVVSTPPADLTQEIVTAANQAITQLNTRQAPLAQATAAALQQLLRDNVPKPATRGTKRI